MPEALLVRFGEKRGKEKEKFLLTVAPEKADKGSLAGRVLPPATRQKWQRGL
jgi:hypothetical protein